jgi:hypothetical protein
MRKVLTWIFLAFVAMGSCALLERGDGSLEPYKIEEVR